MDAGLRIPNPEDERINVPAIRHHYWRYRIQVPVEDLIEKHKDEFIETLTEKLLMYSLGRGIEPADKPAVRAIARAAARENYRMSAFLNAIVESVPFQMRRASQK